MRIRTLQPRVPWGWVAGMMLPWMALHYGELLSGAPLTFTLRKFVDQPALIALLSSLNVGFNFLVGAVASYLSDRIWTRWGRRRPFLLVGWSGAALMLVGIPLAPNLAVLAALIVLYQFFMDIARPYEPLYNEVVPPPQRGRAGVLRNISTSVTGLLFSGVMLAQFDQEYHSAPGAWWSWQVRGEHLVYWAGAAACLGAVAFLLVGVRETQPRNGAGHERFTVTAFLREIFADRRWWMVYGLYVCPLLSGTVVRVFFPLTLTEQVGLDKAQFGRIESLTMLVNLVLFVPLAGFLADRFSRLRLLQVALTGVGTINLGLFLLLRFGPEGSVSIPIVIALSLLAGTGGAFVALKYVLWGPLVYDFIPSSRFGTVSAGFSFVGGLVSFLLINLAGLWVEGFTALAGATHGAIHDYSSVFLLQAALTMVAVGFCQRFARELRDGRIVAYARVEHEAAANRRD